MSPGTGEQDVTPPAQPAAKDKAPETVTLTKAEHAALVRERDEARDSERFWAQRARSGQPEPEPEPEDDGPQASAFVDDEGEPDLSGDTPDKLVDEFAANGVAALRKRGFITAADAKKLAADIAVKVTREIVDRKVQAIQSDSQLVGDFKDLQDPKSELFQAAAPIYQKLVKMNGGKQTTALLYAAAEAAKAKLDAKAPPARPKPREDDDVYDRYDEEDRRARADAQGAGRGRRAPVEDDSQDMLGPEARAICAQMGIKEEDFLASQKELGRTRGRRR